MWTSQAPHGSFPVNIQRFSTLADGLPLQSPAAAAQGSSLSPQLTEGPCQAHMLQGCRRCLLCSCLARKEEREPAWLSEVLCDCPEMGGDILAQEEAEGPQFCQTKGVRNGVDSCALCSPPAAVQQSGVAKPHVALSHRGTLPIVSLFFFRHCKIYYLKGMGLGNERCGKIPWTKALISIISTLPWISSSISSSSVLGSSLGVIKVLLKL